jgi:hypothetical protein
MRWRVGYSFKTDGAACRRKLDDPLAVSRLAALLCQTLDYTHLEPGYAYESYSFYQRVIKKCPGGCVCPDSLSKAPPWQRVPKSPKIDSNPITLVFEGCNVTVSQAKFQESRIVESVCEARRETRGVARRSR